MMKKTLVLAMAMVLGVTASVYAANPFSDVPAGHWAYVEFNSSRDFRIMMPLTDWRQPELLMVMAMVILAANV